MHAHLVSMRLFLFYLTMMILFFSFYLFFLLVKVKRDNLYIKTQPYLNSIVANDYSAKIQSEKTKKCTAYCDRVICSH